MCNANFYVCEKCGNVIEIINASGVSVVCCGQKMTRLEAGAREASHEKHIPVVKVEDGKVFASVGSVTHPMSEEHSILWIALETDKGINRVDLSPTDAPEASFLLGDAKPVAVYAYCNLHGLWKSEI